MVYSTHLIAIVTASLLALNACASNGPGTMTTTTSDPRTVDAREDNADVLRSTRPGLVVSLVLDGTRVSSHEVQIAAVSDSSSAPAGEESVKVTALAGGTEVATMSMADAKFEAAEGVGLVTVEKRTLIGRLVLPTRIDALAIEVPGAAEVQQVDVRRAFAEYCEERPNDQICGAKER